jgi:hypothetical protein
MSSRILTDVLADLVHLKTDLRDNISIEYTFQKSARAFSETGYKTASLSIVDAKAFFGQLGWNGRIACKPFFGERAANMRALGKCPIWWSSIFYTADLDKVNRITFIDMTIKLSNGLTFDALSDSHKQQLEAKGFDEMTFAASYALYHNAPTTLADLIADPSINNIDKIIYLYHANTCARNFIEELRLHNIYHFGMSPTAIRCWKTVDGEYKFGVGNYSMVSSHYLKRIDTQYVAPRILASALALKKNNTVKISDKVVKTAFLNSGILNIFTVKQVDEVFDVVYLQEPTDNMSIDVDEIKISHDLGLHQSIFAMNATFYKLYKQLDDEFKTRMQSIDADEWPPYLSKIAYFYDVLDMRLSVVARIRHCLEKQHKKHCYERHQYADDRLEVKPYWASVALFIYLRFEFHHVEKKVQFQTVFNGDDMLVTSISASGRSAVSFDSQAPVNAVLLEGFVKRAFIVHKVHKDVLSEYVREIRRMDKIPPERYPFEYFEDDEADSDDDSDSDAEYDEKTTELVTFGVDGHEKVWELYRGNDTGTEYYVVGNMKKRYLKGLDYKPASNAAVVKFHKDAKEHEKRILTERTQRVKDRTKLWKSKYSTDKYVTLGDEEHKIKYLLYHVPGTGHAVLQDETNDVWKSVFPQSGDLKYVEEEYNGEVIIMRGTKKRYYVIEIPDGNKYVYDDETDESIYLTDAKLKGNFKFQKSE